MQVQYGVSDGCRHALLRRVGGAGVAVDERGRRAPLAARPEHDAEPGNVNTAAYTMGDQTYPDRTVTASDGYQRQVFPLVVQIRK